jgi:glycine betaine/choline ABC-type transport system substrate-binding protein
MDLSLIYRALAQKQVDVIAGDATSGLIDAYGFVMLLDDRHYFPPYDAVPVTRSATLLRYPDAQKALESLAGRISIADMRRMNRAVDSDRQDPAGVAGAFLASLERDQRSKG